MKFAKKSEAQNAFYNNKISKDKHIPFIWF